MGAAELKALDYSCELDRNSGQELLDLNAAVQSMVKAFNQLTQNLSAKEQQITELFQEQRIKDEQALNQMSQRLKVSLEAAAIAHEINQPLSILRLTAQRLQHQVRDSADAERFSGLQKDLQLLNEQASCIGRTTDQIKAILRNAKTNLSRVDLVNVLESIRLYVASNLKEARDWVSITLPADLGQQGAWVDGDAIQLQIAVINLLNNAVDALLLQPPATAPPQIVISLEREAQSWVIAIDDNGPGLPDDHLSQLPLTSTKRSGSGLGLFIVRSAMESHHGELSLGASPTGGTRATLILPSRS